ncbi:MAG: hypothetical protein JOZ62_04220 [Acidobacteriaceae bacterium]|nr:hypothetical protein [Acidobacteriaceae bacterium]
MDRLDTLERQNQALLSEVQALREQIKAAAANSAPNATIEDQVEVNTRRIDEQAETKVEASQRFPLSVSGMFLFDASLINGRSTPYSPFTYSSTYFPGASSAGATLRESMLNFQFHGPRVFAGGRVNGLLSMDFYAASGDDSILRLRRGTVSIDWNRRSVLFGQDKSLIAPYEPRSFARVGIPPLSGAGNLWFWRPQVRYEERLPFTANTGATFQIGVLETREDYSVVNPPSTVYSTSRPALQSRIELHHTWNESSRLTLGIAGHGSESHFAGQSIPSRVVSMDLNWKPNTRIEFTGTLLRGRNFANLGGEPPGISAPHGVFIPIRGTAGWLQLALPLTSRLTFDMYGGRQVNNPKDLLSFQNVRTLSVAGNVIYQFGPNVVGSVEISRDQVDYLNLHQLIANRYDATLAYLF